MDAILVARWEPIGAFASHCSARIFITTAAEASLETDPSVAAAQLTTPSVLALPVEISNSTEHPCRALIAEPLDVSLDLHSTINNVDQTPSS